MEPKELTPAEVALMHRISRTTVYRLIYAGDLAAHRVGIQYRVTEANATALRRSTSARSAVA